jgi:mannose-1-phosphate guanylyltransferase
MRSPHPLWTVVLAAGSGRRLASVTGGIPKQFWRAYGTTSLLEATVARVAPLAPATQTMVVVDRGHVPFVRAMNSVDRLGRVLYQPADRGTGAGVLFGLLPVLEAAPDDLVLLTPSDHGVLDTARFQQTILATAVDVWSGTADVVLFGVEPADPDSDYGWISPAEPQQPGPEHQLRRIAGFVEKPSASAAARLRRSGAVWNTMVLVTRPSVMLHLYREHAPWLADVFDAAMARPPLVRAAFLEHQYRHLPPSDFSGDILAHADGLALCTWPAAMGWSDLGTPDRLERWLRLATPRPAPAAFSTAGTEPAA